MTPDKALELVGRYARLTKEIKLLKQQIGEHMDKCPGVNGDRHAVDANGWHTYQPELDSKNRDKGLHLWNWYQPFTDYDSGYPHQAWEAINDVEHAEQCPHCYAAHQAIQLRKVARKSLGAVKAAMTRSAA